MSDQKYLKKGIKIFLIVIGCLFLITIILILFVLLPFAKSKIISYVENNTEYSLKINTIAYTGFNNLVISGIEFKPKLNIKGFYEKDHTERDWIALHTNYINIDGIHWKALILDKKLVIDKITITDPDIYAYRNKKMPDPAYKHKYLPAHLLKHAKASVTVLLIELVHGSIEYEENPEKGSPGKIRFAKLYGSLTGLSTDSVNMKRDSLVVLTGKGLIMDSIEGNMRYAFSLLSKDDEFTFEGHTGPFSAAILNKCITPMTKAEIQSGYVEKVSLRFRANEHHSKGKIKIDYRNLKLDVLSKNDSHKKSIIKSFLSHVVLKKDNEMKNGEKQSGDIDCMRRKDRFIFSYWWNSIKSGVVSEVSKIDVDLSPKKKTDKHKKHH